jgi:hypothetical protein
MGGCGFGFDARRANRYDGVMCITFKKLRWAMTLGMLPDFLRELLILGLKQVSFTRHLVILLERRFLSLPSCLTIE